MACQWAYPDPACIAGFAILEADIDKTAANTSLDVAGAEQAAE